MDLNTKLICLLILVTATVAVVMVVDYSFTPVRSGFVEGIVKDVSQKDVEPYTAVMLRGSTNWFRLDDSDAVNVITVGERYRFWLEKTPVLGLIRGWSYEKVDSTELKTIEDFPASSVESFFVLADLGISFVFSFASFVVVDKDKPWVFLAVFCLMFCGAMMVMVGSAWNQLHF